MVLYKNRQFTVHENAYSIKIHKIVKIQTQNGIRLYSKVKIPYEDSFEQVDILKARIIKTKGYNEKNPSDRCISPSKSVDNEKKYDVKYKIIQFPNLKINSIIEYNIKKKRTKLIDDKYYWDVCHLQENNPIIKQKYIVKIPKKHKIHIKQFRLSKKPNTTINTNNKVISWECDNIPSVSIEEFMPPHDEIISQIWISSFSSWDELAHWLQSIYNDKIIITDEIKQKSEEIIQSATNETEKIQRIVNWIALHIKYIIDNEEDPGLIPQHTSKIFNNKYGDCKDKAILLVAMLRSIGIHAYPGFINRYKKDPDLDIPIMQFNHCITIVKNKNNVYYIDPTIQNQHITYIPLGMQNKTCLILRKKAYELLKIPEQKPEDNKNIRKTTITIHENKSITVKKIDQFKGRKSYETRNWFSNTPQKDIKIKIQQIITNRFQNGTLLDYIIKNLDTPAQPLYLEQTYIINNWIEEIQPNTFALKLPNVNIIIQGINQQKRTTPIDYETTELLENEIIIEFPKNIELKNIPENVKLINKYALFDLSVEKKSTTNLLVKLTFQRNVARIPANDYQEWKRFCEELLEITNQKFIYCNQ